MRFFTIDQIAEQLHMTVGTVRNRLCRGDSMPPSVKVGRRRLFPEEDFKTWVNQRKQHHGSTNTTAVWR
jgi:excisionase family DNA binding protein